MKNCLWWGKGLFTLLLFTILATWGCTTSEPAEEKAGLEVTEGSEPLEEEGLQGEELGTEQPGEEGQEQDQLLDVVEEIGQNDLGTPEEDQVPEAVPASPVTEVFVGGKAGIGMAPGLPEEGSKMVYIVQKGDTLSRIAKRIFNDLGRWKELAEISQIKNPNRIFPGDLVYYQLNQQSLAFAKKYENLQRNLTEVKEGENLAEVSKRLYGNADNWKLLWRHNDHISNPNKLVAGTLVYYVVSSDLYSKVLVDSTKEPLVKSLDFVLLKNRKSVS
ncbi:MAG: LysM peptidoglycan-binding domain-containing protein [Deltaproteobacteria bacterium]|nr:LysM peptidoglycan-binding domain-containing protein [Deltaproteobacteria bacterium]